MANSKRPVNSIVADRPYSERLLNLLSHLKKYELILIFLLVFVIYNLNFRIIDSGDTVPASLLPFSILNDHSLYLDQFIGYFHAQGWVTYYFYNTSGHSVSTYPIVTPILATPLYIVPYLLLKIAHIPLDLANPIFNLVVMIMEKISASVIASIAVSLLYLTLKEIIDRKVAMIAALIFALGTSTWTIGSQSLWQQGMVELLLVALIYIIVINEKKHNEKNYIYMGILSGLFIFNRPSDSPLLLPILLYIVFCSIREKLYYIGSMVIISLPFIVYNLFYFKSIFGAYANQLSLFNIHGIINGLAGLLVSPSRGLLIYSPIVILAIPGFLKVPSLKNRTLKLVLYMFLASIVIELLMYGSFSQWPGGCCFGPRFLTAILPVLFIYIGLFLNGIIREGKIDNWRKAIIFVIIILTLISIFVQIIGAFCYTNGGWKWDLDLSVRSANVAFWDWHDTQLTRSISYGPGSFTILDKANTILSGG